MLKELVDGLHVERTEEVRKRRVSVQALAEMQRVQQSVMQTFIGYHAECKKDVRKWNLLSEEGSFWCRQPKGQVTKVHKLSERVEEVVMSKKTQGRYY